MKLHANAVTLAEVRHKSNVINIDQLGCVALPRRFDPQNITRQQDMIGDVIRTFRDQAGVAARDGIVIPGSLVSLRQLNLFSPAELVKEAEDSSFGLSWNRILANWKTRRFPTRPLSALKMTT